MKSSPMRKNLVEDKMMQDKLSADGFNNFTAKLGLQTENISAVGQYTIGSLISRNRAQLEYIYRSSWIAGQVVDTVAEDMTKEGIMMLSKMSPDDINEINSKMTEMAIWDKICSTIKWARLYGGAIAVMLIDGADYTKPFDIKKVGKNTFKGLAVFDRWQLDPSFGDLITELGPDMGKPKFYTILPAMETMSTIKVHYSRLIRLDGIEMPYYQKKYDNLWGMSVIERMLDRLLAFDSATQGAAQLIYKAHLRVVQIDGLRQALAMGGKTESAVIKQFQYIRLMQTNEGITLLDKNDTFTPHQYTFAGLADMLNQFGQQISGAVNIPLVRLFGQSPSGFSTGETDLRNYYDNIHKLQEKMLRTSMHKVLDVMSMSIHGKPLPEDFEFKFNSLWSLSDSEKSQVATSDAAAINTAYQSGIITKKIAMKELAQNSHITGRFSNIKEKDIEEAKEEPPEHQGMGAGLPGLGGEEPTDANPGGEVSLEELQKKLDALGGNSKDKTLEQLQQELDNIEVKGQEGIAEEKTLAELRKELDDIDIEKKKIIERKDADLQELQKQLGDIILPVPFPKMTADGRLAKVVNSIRRLFPSKGEKHVSP